MRIQTELFVAFALVILPFQQSVANNNFSYEMDEATSRIMEAEYQRQLRANQHSKRKKTQRKQQVKIAPPTKRVVAAAPQRIPAPVTRHVPPAHQQAKVPEADELFGAASSGNVASIGRLLNQGANINAINRERETALHMAAAKGHYSAVIYLINHGANVNARTIKNWIPLHHAVRFRHANIANYLMRRGSPVHARTSDGMNAIDMAKTTRDQRMLNILGAR